MFGKLMVKSKKLAEYLDNGSATFEKILKEIKLYKEYEHEYAYEIMSYSEKITDEQRKILFDIVLKKDGYMIKFVCKGKPNKEESEYIIEYIINRDISEGKFTSNQDLSDIFKNDEYIKYALKYIEKSDIQIGEHIIQSVINRIVVISKREYNQELIKLSINIYGVAIRLMVDFYDALSEETIEKMYNIHKEKILKDKRYIYNGKPNIYYMYRVCEVLHKYIDSSYVMNLVDNICEVIDTEHGELIMENINKFKLTEDEIDEIDGKLILLKLAV